METLLPEFVRNHLKWEALNWRPSEIVDPQPIAVCGSRAHLSSREQ